MISQKKITRFLNNYFDIFQFSDVGYNGVQIEADAQIDKVCFAVDACLESIEQTIAQKAQLLIVHHGLFWGRETPITGVHYQRIKALIQNNVALYAVHIPLDVHPEIGNNASLAKALELKVVDTFGEFKRTPIILGTTLDEPMPVLDFQKRVETVLGAQTHLINFGKKKIQKVALCTGDASFGVNDAHRKGYDLYFTGEREHISYHLCQDLKFHCLFGGHYATETFGLKSLATVLADKFSIETAFLDIPTEL